jgi:isoquinoline 1-oxidoreductase beta subunit
MQSIRDGLRLGRRAFLAGSSAAAAGLTLPVFVPVPAAGQAAPPAQPSAPNAYLRIGTDGRVVFILPTCEMGQGTHTGQAQILAEELGADWTAVSVEMPTRPGPDYRLPFGQMRSVGSYGIRHFHDPMRRAAAQARTMLVEAAARRLGVDAASLSAEGGAVVHAASGRRIPFGDLVEDAAALPVPAEPALRPASERTLTGRPVPRLDTPAKVAGAATFSIDVERPGMLHGAVRLAPVYAADVESIDEASVLGMPGVEAVVRVPRGAVVVARSWWQAKQAADALRITFTRTPADALDTPAIDRMLEAGLSAPDALPVARRGDPEAAFAAAARVVEADYAVPLLTHVCMEPISCTAESTEERTELWLGTQGHDAIRMGLEAALGIPAEKLSINTTYLGGGFGRKTRAHEAIQAILASRAVGGRPVKVLWSREDDVRQGFYRQTMAIRFRAALDASGRMTAIRMRMSGPQMGVSERIPIRDNMDPFSLLGLVNMHYRVPAFELEHAVVPLPVPLSPWRSIAESFNGFFLESFVDECAHAAGRDPLEFRRAHLEGRARPLAVLRRAEEMAGRAGPPPAGRTRGVAMVESYGSPVAQVVEVSMDGGRVRVERVWAAIDCGRAINPGQVEQQVQGAVVEAMGAALRVKVTLRDGRAEQSNFHDYPIVRIDEAPRIEVSVVESEGPLGGVGEPGVPPFAPALANAVFAATGRRVRRLPLADAGLA